MGWILSLGDEAGGCFSVYLAINLSEVGKWFIVYLHIPTSYGSRESDVGADTDIIISFCRP